MTDSPPPLLRPLPRRPFELSSATGTPRNEEESIDDSNSSPASYRRSEKSLDDAPENLSKSRSILNLTSSTLFGIYSPTALDSSSYRGSEPATPWGTGAETPAPRASIDGGRPIPDVESPTDRLKQPDQQIPRRRQGILPQTARLGALFVLGVGYGALVSHLHDNQHISPVRVEGIDHQSWTYCIFWGFAAVGMGSLLPYFDTVWHSRHQPTQFRGKPSTSSSTSSRDDPSSDWSTVVRNIGAFVGVAFAIVSEPSSPNHNQLTCLSASSHGRHPSKSPSRSPSPTQPSGTSSTAPPPASSSAPASPLQALLCFSLQILRWYPHHHHHITGPLGLTRLATRSPGPVYVT